MPIHNRVFLAAMSDFQRRRRRIGSCVKQNASGWPKSRSMRPVWVAKDASGSCAVLDLPLSNWSFVVAVFCDWSAIAVLGSFGALMRTVFGQRSCFFVTRGLRNRRAAVRRRRGTAVLPRQRSCRSLSSTSQREPGSVGCPRQSTYAGSLQRAPSAHGGSRRT